jgi:hypothetical protein
MMRYLILVPLGSVWSAVLYFVTTALFPYMMRHPILTLVLNIATMLISCHLYFWYFDPMWHLVQSHCYASCSTILDSLSLIISHVGADRCIICMEYDALKIALLICRVYAGAWVYAQWEG